ncbi:MAG: hypothetical protein WD055_06140 [Candidatus Dependentiae bacterium]
MKKNHSRLLIALLLPMQLQAVCPVAPLFVPRSQSANVPAFELAGLTNHINIFDMEKFYGTFAVTPMYSRSFKENEISKCLFGDSLVNCDCPNINVSGSGVANRGQKDWLADYFGLPTDYESTLSFKPRISNYLVDFYMYLGLDEWLCGLFFFIHAPVVNTRWDLNYCESIENMGTAAYPIGYFTPEEVPRSTLRDSVSEYMSDCNGIDLGDDVFVQPLNVARIACDSKSDTALADIRFALGWNFFQDEDYHVGLGFAGAAPTGTRPKGEFLFEPIVGNGHHWELGGLAWGHVVFWRSECEEKFFAGWMQANITHMFKTKQHRFFDLKCKPMSRYMLAERMTTDVTQLLANEDEGSLMMNTVPSNQFNKLFAPVANLTAQDVDVSVNVQADIVGMLTYTSCGFTWDLGYNFWARTCEKFDPNCDCPPAVKDENWALKGNAHVFGFTDRDNGVPADTPVALSATQSDATIHAGTNVTTDIGGMMIAANRNPVIDNRQWATSGDDTALASALLLNQPGGNQTNTSKEPVLIDVCDIDFNNARTKGLSQKVFTHFSYSWLDNEDWTPYLGAGAQVEFAQDDNNKCATDSCNTNPCANNNCSGQACTTNTNCFTCDDDCQRCAISQWAVWIKAGVSFN